MVQSGRASSLRENASGLMLVSPSAPGAGFHFSSRSSNFQESLVNGQLLEKLLSVLVCQKILNWAIFFRNSPYVYLRSNFLTLPPFLLQSNANVFIAALQARHFLKIVEIYCFLLARMAQAVCSEDDCKQPRVGKGQVSERHGGNEGFSPSTIHIKTYTVQNSGQR
jgi:hypothetical protein